MSVKVRRVVVMAWPVLLVVPMGCGSPAAPSESYDPAPSTSTTTTAPPAASAPAPAPAPSIASDATAVDINIAGGAVTPTNGQAQGRVGKPVILRVNSDVSDQLHVHSVPEHTFQVEPRRHQTFEFTVDVPGQVDVELHDLNRTVVTVQVRP